LDLGMSRVPLDHVEIKFVFGLDRWFPNSVMTTLKFTNMVKLKGYVLLKIIVELLYLEILFSCDRISH